jgi:hypothetical protein
MASKGKLIMDASSYAPLIKSIHKMHWKVEKVKRADRHMTDTNFLAKYAGGRHPVITTDRTMWKENPAKGGATAGSALSYVGKSALVRVFWRNVSTRNTRYRLVAGITPSGCEHEHPVGARLLYSLALAPIPQAFRVLRT